MITKAAIRIYKWIILSVMFQVLVLVFFNNIYLAGRGEATATLSEDKDQDKQNYKKQAITVSIPDSAINPRVSFDNTYVSYVLDGKLEIYDIKNKKIVKSISHKKDIITYYRWLSDRNMIIYSVRTPNDEPGAVQIITYSVDTEVQHDYPRITGLPRKSEVVSIELSHLTNSVYTKVKTNENDAKIYRYNVMSQLFHVTNTSSETVTKEMHYKDKLVYQDDKYKINVFTWSEPRGATVTMPFKNKMALIGIVGSDDEIYLGEMDSDNKVHRVIYGRSNVDPEKEWKQLSLKTPTSPENLVVAPNGSVFELIDSKKVIYNISENTELSYSGKFVEVSDKHIVTLDGKELKIAELE